MAKKAKKATKKTAKKTAKKAEIPKRTNLELREPQPFNFGKIIIFAVLVIVALVFILIPPPETADSDDNLTGVYAPINPNTTSVEDFDFLVSDTLATDLNIRGVGLGDTRYRVEKLLGEPDRVASFSTGAYQVNYEYNLDTNGTAIMIILIDDRVNRITFYDGLDLQGNSSFSMDKTAVYNRMGLPTETRDMATFRRFIYDERGIEVLIKRKDHFGTSLFYPNTTAPRVLGQVNVTVDEAPTGEVKI